jgi:hypothetical protein
MPQDLVLKQTLAGESSIGKGQGVLVPRTHLRRPYYVTAAPLRRILRPFLGMATPVAVVLIRDPERRRPVARDTLRHAYGLTAREAALALMLVEGHTLEEAAERLTMRYETAGRARLRCRGTAAERSVIASGRRGLRP